jgi:hypothetical protein
VDEGTPVSRGEIALSLYLRWFWRRIAWRAAVGDDDGAAKCIAPDSNRCLQEIIDEED